MCVQTFATLYLDNGHNGETECKSNDNVAGSSGKGNTTHAAEVIEQEVPQDFSH